MHTTLLSTTRKDKCEDNLGFLTKTMDATKAWQKAGEAERHRSGTKAVSSFLNSFVKNYEWVCPSERPGGLTAFMAHVSHNHVTILCSDWSFWLLLCLPVGSHRVFQPPPHDYIKHRQDEQGLFVFIHHWLTFAAEGHIPTEDNTGQCMHGHSPHWMTDWKTPACSIILWVQWLVSSDDLKCHFWKSFKLDSWDWKLFTHAL